MKGKESVMSVAGIQGLSDLKTEVVTARIGRSEIDTAGEEPTFCSHRNLNVGDKIYDFTKMNDNYAYLTDLTVLKVSMNVVNGLHGQDAYHLIRPLEYKSGDRIEPWASKLPWDGQSVGHYPKQTRTV